MAKKTTHNNTTRKRRAGTVTKKKLLFKKARFSTPVLIIIISALVILGYFVIRSFAATSFYRAAGKCASVSTTAGYTCFFDSADGLAARMYITLLNRTPTAASVNSWADRIISTGSPAVVAQQMVSTSEGQGTFLVLSQGSRVNRMYFSNLNRGTVKAGDTGKW